MFPQPAMLDVSEVHAFLAQMPADGQQIAPEAERAWLSALDRATEESLNATLGVSGWAYRDIPWTTQQLWDMLFNIVGTTEDCIKVVTMNTREVEHEGKRQTAIRGSLLICPEGIEIFRNHVEEKEERTKKAQP